VTNAVRLTPTARQRFPDIGASHGALIAHGTRTGNDTHSGYWLRVEWPGDRTTWLRAEDLEPVTDQPEETP
jgi:hypothetical protein